MAFRRILVCLAALVIPLTAQESELPLGINLPTAEHLQGWQLGVRFTHRFLEPVRNGSKDLYGLDGGNYPGFGLDVGIKAIPGLNGQVYRTADGKTLLFGLQQQVLDGSVFRLSLRAERFDETILKAQVSYGTVGISGYALQLPAELRFGGTFTFLLVPTYLSRSTSEDKAAWNAGVGVRWHFSERQTVLAEYYPRPSRLDSGRYKPGAGIAYRFQTRGHRFTLLASNTAGTTAHQVLSGDYGGGPRPFQEWALGFNLVRLF